MHHLANLDDSDEEYVPRQKLTDEEFDKMEQELKNHPLFLQQIPEDISEYPALQALQNIEHDDTPENLAVYFNKKGNEAFKKGPFQKYWLQLALDSYSDGIDKQSSDTEMNAKLHNNRALIQFRNKNYGKAIEDAKKAISLNPKFVRAYHRCAQSQVILHKYKEAVECLLEGIKHAKDPNDLKELQELKTQALKQLNQVVEKKKAAISSQEQSQQALFEECKKKNIILGKRMMDFPDNCRKSVFLDKKTLQFPIFVSYPEFQTMDYIDKVPETDTLIPHLQEIIGAGLPYDKEGKYALDNIEVYIENNSSTALWDIPNIRKWPKQQGIQKVDLSKSVLDIFRSPGYILPMVPEIVVVSPNSKAFYESFLRDQAVK